MRHIKRRWNLSLTKRCNCCNKLFEREEFFCCVNHLLLCNNKEKEGKKYVLHEWIHAWLYSLCRGAGLEQGISQSFFCCLNLLNMQKMMTCKDITFQGPLCKKERSSSSFSHILHVCGSIENTVMSHYIRTSKLTPQWSCNFSKGLSNIFFSPAGLQNLSKFQSMIDLSYIQIANL